MMEVESLKPKSKRYRIYVSTAVNALIFLFAIGKFWSIAPWSREEEKAIIAFWQTAVAPRQLDTTVTFSLWSLRFAFGILCFYLVRLYMSLTVFDILPKYFKMYIQPLDIISRKIEWTLRFGIFAYLIVGLSGYGSIVGLIRRLGPLSVYLSKSLPGAEIWCDVMLYLCGLFGIFILWDIYMIVMHCAIGKNRAMFMVVVNNFGRDHLCGLALWILFYALFSNEDLAISGVVLYGIGVIVALLVMAYLTAISLFQSKKRNLQAEFRKAMLVEVVANVHSVSSNQASREMNEN